MITDPEILAAIASYLNENATEEEKQLVESWLAEDEKNKTILQNLAEPDYDTMIREEASLVKEKIYYQIQQRIRNQAFRRKLHIWQFVAAASVALLIIIGGIRFLQPGTKLLANIETHCPTGSTSKLILSDGSTVNLNAGSTLSYPAQFKKDTRTVILHGEGYFQVAKDTKKPFVVEVNNLKVTVLGTHFNIRSYENDENIVTTLLEGSVSVEKRDMDTRKTEPIILSPNQQLIFNKKNNSLDIRDVDAHLYASWKDGQYYFDNEKFSDIVKKLERSFGVKITIKSARLENQVYSGVFTQGENIQQILNLFKKHRNFDYKQNGNEIEIYEKK